MTWTRSLIVLTVLQMVALISAQAPAYEDFIDPYNADDTFHVDCGNRTDKKMRIVFRGNAHKVYNPNIPGCTAEEVEPAHFEITDAIDGNPCNAEDSAGGLEILTFEVVVQKHYVRSHDDEIFMVTCNYELGSQALTNKNTGEHSKLQRTGHVVQANGAGVPSGLSVALGIRDVHNIEVTKSHIGSYIQLYAVMTQVDFRALVSSIDILLTLDMPLVVHLYLTVVRDDLIANSNTYSFRVWNCKAFSNHTGVYAEHHILVQGCGDDKVIKADRGFRTSMVDEGGVTYASSRSVFFRTFTLLHNNKIQFECDYIISQGSQEGPSCHRSPAFTPTTWNRRKRRSAEAENEVAEIERTKRTVQFELELPYVQSQELEIVGEEDMLPEINEDNDIISYQVRREDDDEESEVPAVLANRIRGRTNRVRYQNDLPEAMSVLSQPLVIGLMATCAILLILPLLMVCFMFVSKQRVREARPRYAGIQSPIFVPESPTVDSVNLKLIR